MIFGFIITFVFGVIIGLLLMSFSVLSLMHGTLLIDRHNPEKDLYRFDINVLDDLTKRKYILLKVDSKADLSQK